MIDAILNLLFPQSCVLCNAQIFKREWAVVCPECWSKLEPIPRPFCPQCGMPAPVIEGLCGSCRRGDYSFDLARSLFLFTEPMRGMLHHFKYSGRISLARPLGFRLRDHMNQEGFQGRLVLPVPLHRARERERGFNQADLLSRHLGLTVDTQTAPASKEHAEPDRPEPLTAGIESFRGLRGSRKPPECVLVVDDVYTTGATLHEIAKTLKRAGTSRVEVLTVARVLRQE